MAKHSHTDKIQKVTIAAAGTGGHVYPALAIAIALGKKGIFSNWIGTGKGIERRLVKSAQLPFDTIEMRGIRGKGLVRWLLMPFILLGAIFEARSVLHKNRPDKVVVFGGYISVPVGLAARWLKIPVEVMEQNAASGLSNRILAKVAQKIYCGFECDLKGDKVIITGNPVRESIACVPSLKSVENRPIRILVLGGSLGARILNEIVPDAVHIAGSNFEVYHQTGEKTFEVACQKYDNHGMYAKVRVVKYIDNIAEIYRWCDLVICRAGALTVSEVAAAGRAAIFVPLPNAVDDHQCKNALYLTSQDAAVLLPQSNLTPESLAQHLKDFDQNPSKLVAMAHKAKALALPDATQNMVSGILQWGE